MNNHLPSPAVLRRIYHFFRFVWRVTPTGEGRIGVSTAWFIARVVS